MFATYQDDPSAQIAITALALFAGIVLAVIVLGSLFRFLPGRKALRQSLVGDLAGMFFVIFLPGMVAAGGALLLTPLLLAIGTPTAVWIAVALGTAAWSVAAMRESNNGFKGCVTMLMVGVFGYLAIWATTGAVLTYRSSAGFAPLSEAVRIAILTIPVGLWVATKSRSGDRLATASAFTAALAVLLAVIFLPIERGLLRSTLPQSDWLRFPVAAAIATLALGLLIDWRVNRGDRVKAADRIKFHIFFPACGALVGVIWAALYQLGKQL